MGARGPMPDVGCPGEAGRMATLTHQQPAPVEHDVRSMGAVLASAAVLVALLVGAAGVLGSIVDLAGWAMSST